MIRIDSAKHAATSALIMAMINSFYCALYDGVIMLFTGGEEFVAKDRTRDFINGLDFIGVLIVCAVLAAAVQAVLLRIERPKMLLLYLPVTVIAFYVAATVVMMLTEEFLNAFDFIAYAVWPAPIGIITGTLTAAVLGTVKRKKQSSMKKAENGQYN